MCVKLYQFTTNLINELLIMEMLLIFLFESSWISSTAVGFGLGGKGVLIL